VENYSSIGQVTDKNMAHAHCVLDTSGYKHTLRICNDYCFYPATVVARKRLNATLYVHSYFYSLLFQHNGKNVAYLDTTNVWLKFMMIY
jgi:hypothetical protein